MLNVVITGASQRLGLYLTQRYLESGNSVFAITRKASKELKSISSNNIHIIEIENYTDKSARYAVQEINKITDEINLLVNNASYFVKDLESENNPLLYNDFFSTHMLFPYELIITAKELLQTGVKPGVVVNVTDIFAVNPNSDYSLYCSTKAGLSNLSLSFAKMFKGLVRVNNVAPGPIKFLPSHSKIDIENVLSQSLIKNEGGFEPILKTIDFIVDNDYLTGCTINVDGGRSINSW